jgi:pyrophosphatase PpaX
VRFPVVLFDFDGTVLDSGEIILASMRHATKTVLGREIEDEVLMAAVGGSGLVEQMRLLDESRVDELVAVYRAHNEPLHTSLSCCVGMEDALARLKEEGRRLGIVTAKRRETVALAFETVAIEHLFDVVVDVGDSPFDIRAAKAAGVHAIAVTWGGIHSRERLEAEGPDALVDSAEELLAAL